MISVLILTFNEEHNIKRCLDSVKWSDDVLVLDSFSSDRTVDLALEAGSRVLQNKFVNFAEQRNFGLRFGEFKHEWVLHLDADEAVTPGLQQELMETTRSHGADAYRVGSKLMLEDRWIRFSGAYPNYQVRFGRRDVLQFVQVGHGQRENLPLAGIGTLKEPMLHYSFSKGLEDWFSKHNRYSSAEAAEAMRTRVESQVALKKLFSGNSTERRRAIKDLAVQLPCRPLLKFLYMYFLRLGFLDGGPGWRYCRMLSIYESMTVLKLRELRQNSLQSSASMQLQTDRSA